MNETSSGGASGASLLVSSAAASWLSCPSVCRASCGGCWLSVQVVGCVSAVVLLCAFAGMVCDGCGDVA